MCAHTMSVKALIVAKKMEKMTQGTTPCCSIAQGYDSSPAPAAAMNKFTQADSNTLERTRVMHCSAAFIPSKTLGCSRFLNRSVRGAEASF